MFEIYVIVLFSQSGGAAILDHWSYTENRWQTIVVFLNKLLKKKLELIYVWHNGTAQLLLGRGVWLNTCPFYKNTQVIYN